MAMLRILQFPDPRLRTQAAPVNDFGKKTQRLIDDMFETLYNTENCAALATTQLDITNPPQITVIDFSDKKNQPLCLVNPAIHDKTGETNTPEGCMSVAGVYDRAKRAAKIKVTALDRKGNPLQFEADGFMAKCIQHEVDHLHGTVFLDHLPPHRRRRADRTLKKALRKA